LKKSELEEIVRKCGFRLRRIAPLKHKKGYMIEVERPGHYMVTLFFNQRLEEIPIKEVEQVLCHRSGKVYSMFEELISE